MIGGLFMPEVSWLDFFILVLTAFSIIHLTLNRLSAYFVKKTYLAKWVLCMLTSALIVFFRFYVPYSVFYLIAFAVAGCVELLTDLIDTKKGKTNGLNKEEYIGMRSIVQDMINNQIKGRENSTEEVDKTANIIKKQDKELSNKYKEKKKPKVPNIIDSKRLYNQQEFLKESENGNIFLSNLLRNNLNKPNRTKR